MNEYYRKLGVQPNVSQDDLKKAYRALAKECHPDLHPGDHAAETRFKEINEAYEILSDPEKRKKYDDQQQAAQQREPFRKKRRLLPIPPPTGKLIFLKCKVDLHSFLDLIPRPGK